MGLQDGFYAVPPFFSPFFTHSSRSCTGSVLEGVLLIMGVTHACMSGL